jgi:hypothetical protein
MIRSCYSDKPGLKMDRKKHFGFGGKSPVDLAENYLKKHIWA